MGVQTSTHFNFTQNPQQQLKTHLFSGSGDVCEAAAAAGRCPLPLIAAARRRIYGGTAGDGSVTQHARRQRYVTKLSTFFSLIAPSSGPGPDRIGPVQIFKVTGPVGLFFFWLDRSFSIE